MNPVERDEGKSQAAPGSAHAAGSLEEVREILFGAIYRELERKLARADVHLATLADELQQEAKMRTEALETHLSKEIESLVARLEEEHADAGEAMGRLGREHRESLAALEQRVSRLEDMMVRGQRELRQELLAQTSRFLDELRRHRTEIAAMLEHEIALLHEEEPGLPASVDAEAAPPPH